MFSFLLQHNTFLKQTLSKCAAKVSRSIFVLTVCLLNHVYMVLAAFFSTTCPWPNSHPHQMQPRYLDLVMYSFKFRLSKPLVPLVLKLHILIMTWCLFITTFMQLLFMMLTFHLQHQTSSKGAVKVCKPIFVYLQL